MFDVIYLMFCWLPSPLNILAFGAICILVVVALIKLIITILDMIPFL